jgi:alkylation response protein AidB-like acyl-CoA dehydrogenase
MSAIAFQYSDDIIAIREGLEAFLRREVFRRHERYDSLLNNSSSKYSNEGIFSADVCELIREVRMASAEAGYYAMCAPEEIGGGGLGLVAYFGAWERIHHLCGTKNWLGHHILSHWAKGPSALLLALTPQAKESALAGIMSGQKTLCFGLSEPEAGSDAMMIKSQAVADGDGWRLSGGKIWTTNSPHADYAIVFAVTDSERASKRAGGISAFLIPTAAKGFTRGQVIKMWGSAGGDESVMHFDSIRVESHQLIGELHKGFAAAMLGVNIGRVYNCARVVGLGRWALEMALEYVKIRQTFGRPIAEYQGITFPLVSSAMEIHAAHLMSLNAAQLLDDGYRALKELAMSKTFAVEAGVRALDRVIQAHGAIGMTNELGLTDAFLMLRKLKIADGSNEIMRRIIVKEMLGGDVAL